MIRIVTSLNWVLGTLAIMLAMVYPVVSENLIIRQIKLEVENTVNAIAKAERQRFAHREKYYHFSAAPHDFEKAMDVLELDISAGNFDISAFGTEDEALVIRAVTSPSALRSVSHPPMMYEHKIKHASESGSGGWVTFSNAKPGLLAAIWD